MPEITADTNDEINTALDGFLSKLQEHESIQLQINGGASTVTEGTKVYGTLIKTTNDYAVCYVNGYMYKGSSLYKTKYAGVWQPWEWVNPPMVVGVEYRTTERYLGKPVYRQLVNFGTLPISTTKAIKHGISDIHQVTNADLRNPSGSASLNFYTQVVGVNADAGYISVATSADMSTIQAYCDLGYTKTTD